MIIGTAGHIDHGKTSLVKALTGVDTDRLKEEKARGITVDLGYAYAPLPDGAVLGFVDVPGHEKLVHNMLAGATGIDYVLLTVAADDGPMPQTREHLAILELLRLGRGAVALTKIDRVTPQRRAAAHNEIRSLLYGTALHDCPIFPVSSVSGDGVGRLRTFLDDIAAETPSAPSRGHFRLAVDRVFTLNGNGTVVTGSVLSGEIRVGEQVMVSPRGVPARVRSIHAQNRPAERGRVGQRCALNLAGAGFAREDVRRGDWVLAAPVHAPTQRIDARIRVLASEPRAFGHWTPVHFHIGTLDVPARVALLQGDSVAPGATALAQIVTDKPLCALHGDRFILRDQSATRTVGGGSVLDIFPPVRQRRTRERLTVLHSLEVKDATAALSSALEFGLDGVNLERFALARNLRQEELENIRSAIPMSVVATPGGSWGFPVPRWQAHKLTVLERLAALHEQEAESLGPDRARLQRMTLPALEKVVFGELVAQLLGEGRIAQSGPWLHLPGHKVSLAPDEEKAWAGIRPLLAQQPFQPPRVRDIARSIGSDEASVRRLLKRVARSGEVYLVAHDHYFTREAVQKLADLVQELAQARGKASASAFRDCIGTGRKLAIQILEFFDRIGYTRRAGNAHHLRQADLTL
jgi:selenocysteine-specific elongation factor